jgi:acetoacetate decarboxylase
LRTSRSKELGLDRLVFAKAACAGACRCVAVLEVVSAQHILANLTLGLGKVVHDYLR